MKGNQERRHFLRTGLTAGTGFVIGGLARANAGESLPQTQGMSIWDVFKKRRSVRKFKSTPIPKGHLTRILEAANYAPTPRNRQAWKFLVIQNRDTLNKIKEECIKGGGEGSREYFTDFLSAPVYVVVIADTETRNPPNDITAASLAAMNLMLAARALGYGTVFCVNSVSEDITKRVLNIPDKYKRICITPIGIPEEWPEKEKKGLDEVVVYEKI